MTYNADFVRKVKPKKPDFEHNGKQFWITSCSCVEMWDGEYQDPLISFDVSFYDTDEEVDFNSKIVDDEFIDKTYKKGKKLFPQAGKFQQW